ncbi:MAG: hypothetical protein KKH88_04530 [Nanoarchaeota archaeon]|nr:hypothetical protein [Nanoarchaeota archaeon]
MPKKKKSEPKKKVIHRKKKVHHKKETSIHHKVKKKENFYINVDEPAEIRKDILQAAMETAKIIKSYESIKKLRVHKLKHLDNLYKTMRDVSRLLTHLKKTDMPLYKEIEDQLKKEEQELKDEWKDVEKKIEEKDKPNFTQEEPNQIIEKPEMSGIDKDMADIKEKLSKLNI